MPLDFLDIFFEPLRAADPNKALRKALDQHEEQILDLNRQQMDRGLDARGKSLGRYKNYNYKHRFEPIDLKLTGAFRDKLTLGVKEKESEIFSQDWKQDIIEKRWPDAEGIPGNLIPTVQDIILDDFQENFKQQFDI